MSAPHIKLDLCGKNYQSWWKFDEVTAKNNFALFLRHGAK